MQSLFTSVLLPVDAAVAISFVVHTLPRCLATRTTWDALGFIGMYRFVLGLKYICACVCVRVRVSKQFRYRYFAFEETTVHSGFKHTMPVDRKLQSLSTTTASAVYMRVKRSFDALRIFIEIERGYCFLLLSLIIIIIILNIIIVRIIFLIITTIIIIIIDNYDYHNAIL